MNNLAPRQGIFAIILLVSFCLHILILMFSTEKQQYDYRTDKGEKIVEQLGKEAMVSLANKDRISLSVLANRYQVDDDVAKLSISDANNQILVQTGQSQTQEGQLIGYDIIQNNQLLGHTTITMKAISKGEIISNQWIFILGSAIVHGFLWVVYGYVARPTAQQLEEIGEKVQQRIAITRGSVPHTSRRKPYQELDDDNAPKKSIDEFLHNQIQAQQNHESQEDNGEFNPPYEPIEQPTDNNAFTDYQATYADGEELPSLEIQIRFFDEFSLLDRVAPEVSKPYLQLCSELLGRACDSLFNSNNALINRHLRDIQVYPNFKFTENGAVVHLMGKAEQLPLASVLLGKLVIILNQVVYEKHRELSRFALPMTVGISLDSQFEETHRLMMNHAKEEGLMVLLPKDLLKTLHGQVQYTRLMSPSTITEREVVQYSGLAELLMAELIHKRDEILMENEKYM